MDRDLVLVTFNYRLGPLGFLALGTKEVTGNMGLKDQTMALKWVQRNIRFFGGDPNLVTLAGMSAGGFSSTAHLASEMSQNTFHRMAAMSGAITFQKGFEKDNKKVALEVGAKLDCPMDVDGLYKCLMEVIYTLHYQL